MIPLREKHTSIITEWKDSPSCCIYWIIGSLARNGLICIIRFGRYRVGQFRNQCSCLECRKGNLFFLLILVTHHTMVSHCRRWCMLIFWKLNDAMNTIAIFLDFKLKLIGSYTREQACSKCTQLYLYPLCRCYDCQGFGLVKCPQCGRQGLTPEQRGERWRHKSLYF